MTEVLVWLLVSVSVGSIDQVQTVERFRTQEQCEHVRKELHKMPGVYGNSNRCIQANILVVKP